MNELAEKDGKTDEDERRLNECDEEIQRLRAELAALEQDPHVYDSERY